MQSHVSRFLPCTLRLREREVEGRRSSADHGRLRPDLSGISGEPGSLSSSSPQATPASRLSLALWIRPITVLVVRVAFRSSPFRCTAVSVNLWSRHRSASLRSGFARSSVPHSVNRPSRSFTLHSAAEQTDSQTIH